jgi:hypothetical protein
MQLLKLFPPSFDFICAKATPGGINPNWHTRDRYRLTHAELIRKWADPATIIGLRPLKDTQKLTIDIDRSSKYHAFNNPQLYQELIDCLAEIGLCDGEIVRSSASGGHHLIFVLSETINSFDLACLLYLYLEERGFGVATGQLELFPNVKSFNSNFNAVRLPFQEGSELLESDFNIVPQSHEENMAYLVSRIENNGNDLDLLKVIIRKRKKDFKKLYKQFNSLGNTKIQEWYRDWSETIDMGWTAKMQTNHLLGVFCKFSVVFEGITDPVQLWEQVKTKVLAAPGYDQFCEHQHEIDRRIKDWVRCTLKRYFPLGSRRQINSNGQYRSAPRPRSTVRTDDVKRRIQDAIASVVQQLGNLPQKLTDRLSAIIAASRELGQGLSKNTLYESCYKVLWHNAETAKTRQNEQTDTPQTFSHIYALEKTPKNQPETKTDTAISHICDLMKRYSPEEVNVTDLDSDLGNFEGRNEQSDESLFLDINPIPDNNLLLPTSLNEPFDPETLRTEVNPSITEPVLSHTYDLESPSPLENLISDDYESSNESSDFPVSGVMVMRRSHIYRSKIYPELLARVVRSVGMGWEVVTDTGDRYRFDLSDWQKTWFGTFSGDDPPPVESG